MKSSLLLMSLLLLIQTGCQDPTSSYVDVTPIDNPHLQLSSEVVSKLKGTMDSLVSKVSDGGMNYREVIGKFNYSEHLQDRERGILDVLDGLLPSQILVVVEDNKIINSTEPNMLNAYFVDTPYFVKKLQDSKNGEAFIEYSKKTNVSDPIRGGYIDQKYIALVYSSKKLLSNQQRTGKKFFIFTAIPVKD
jgi:hypothetical protein